MKEFAASEWQRAVATLDSGRHLVEKDPDSAASRAFYAAFHAVTALFAIRGESFPKHSALRAALHRDLIKTEKWPENLGSAYDYLLEMRETGDYGGMMHVSTESASLALENANRILEAVKQTCPELVNT
jgi:uncharacterized protein (UPF0332 family)